MFALVLVASAFLGLCIGSFLNVVVYRVPRHEPIVRPPSACPSCHAKLRARDNVPVLSWLVLRGRCRACREPISIRYPIIELLTAVVFVATAARFGASWTLPAELAFIAGSVALAAVDLERFLLPRAIVYPTLLLVGAGLVAAAGATGQWHRLGVAAACMAAAFVAFALLHFAQPRWLGFGDVRLAAVLGLALGWIGPWYVVIGLFAANLAGAVIGLALIANGRATRSTPIPYGVFLAAGAWIAMWVGGPVIDGYRHLLRG